MKKIFLSLFLLSISVCFAQEWSTNFNEAKALAKKESKSILLVFSGSDWCAPCIKLDKTVWQSQVFKDASKENWILLKADFPKKRANLLSENQSKLNKELAEKYNPEGSFPKVVKLNSDGKVLGIMGFEKITAAAYVAKLKSIR
ncbi:MAG TPA: thioredoxin family protein [Flavobacterium sp.]|nr:thioredoxin family protein [Flavobacterium sp.]